MNKTMCKQWRIVGTSDVHLTLTLHNSSTVIMWLYNALVLTTFSLTLQAVIFNSDGFIGNA